MPNLLHSQKLGDGPPLLIVHGLFGSGDNWRTIGKSFSSHYTVYLIDLRNHGQSFHSDTMSYSDMAMDIKSFCDGYGLEKVTLIGHSMGGKVGMQVSHDYPELLEKLIVADIAPKRYPPQHDDILAGLSAIDFDQVQSRSDILEVLKVHISSVMVQQFLLKSMVCDDKGCRALINIPVIRDQYESIAAAPAFLDGFQSQTPTLFLAGEVSTYILSSDHALMQQYFKSMHVVTVPKAGHWLHAEAPQFCIDVIDSFLNPG